MILVVFMVSSKSWNLQCFNIIVQSRGLHGSHGFQCENEPPFFFKTSFGTPTEELM